MRKWISLILAVGLVMSVSACTFPEQGTDMTPLMTYDKDYAPSQIVKTDNYWVSLISEYFGTDYEISVSTNPEELNSVYSVENVIIWYFEANDEYVAWSEESSQFYEYKVYDIKNDTVETIHKVEVDLGYQLRNIAIYENKIFYPFIDYTNKTADIFCYDAVSKQTVSVCNVPYYEDFSIMCMSVDDHYLSVASAMDVAVVDLISEEVVYRNTLPDEIAYVYSVSYDSVNQKCAIYYADTEGEHIGFIKEDGITLDSHYTFGENHYAFEDKIKCRDGHLYWIVQSDISGDVSDHYKLIDYNYITHKPVETKRVFNVYIDEKNHYFLRFDKSGNYKNIELFERENNEEILSQEENS